MQEQELIDLFTTVHGNVLPITEEIVSEYMPYHEFNISFSYMEDVSIVLEVPVRGWESGVTPNGTEITEESFLRCFSFCKVVGDYRATLFVSYRGSFLNDNGDEVLLIVQRILPHKLTLPRYLVRESQSSSEVPSYIRSIPSGIRVQTGHFTIDIEEGVKVYDSLEAVLENPNQTYISKIVKKLRP